MKNREIKFRTWYGGKMWDDKEAKRLLYNEGCGVNHIDAYTMQFTGLYDKNGKEIYEGDIVSITNDFGYSELATIEYGLDNMAAFCYRYCDDNFILAVSDIATCDTNIVGNIYQHPELLK